jgi:type I site-specific restriction-modification system R (restriction) subunit
MRDALPKASFIGFTGTPIESGDKNTQAVIWLASGNFPHLPHMGDCFAAGWWSF